MKTYSERTKDILEKADAIKKARASRNKKIAAGVSCSLAAVLAVNLAIFLPSWGGSEPPVADMPPTDTPTTPSDPPSDIAGTTDSYADVREKVLAIFDKMNSAGETDLPANPDSEWSSPGGNQTTETDTDAFSEISARQTQGVLRGDLLWRGEKKVYYLTEDCRLQAYTAADMRFQGEVRILPEGNYTLSPAAVWSDADGNVTALLSARGAASGEEYTVVATVETKNDGTMSVSGMQYLSGSYASSYMVGDNFYVLSRFEIASGFAPSDERAFIPAAGSWGQLQGLPASHIYLPERADAPFYTLIAAFSGEGLLRDTRALLSFSEDVYVAQDALYAANTYVAETTFYLKRTETGGSVPRTHVRRETQILRISLEEKGTLRLAAKATVAGKVEGSFSLNEMGSTLCVFTTADDLLTPAGNAYLNEGANADLFLLDAKTLSPLSHVSRFALNGERVYAVRYLDAAAYVRTSQDRTLPAYLFDLTDPLAPTYTRSDTPNCWAAALTPFDGGLYVGIGYDRAAAALEIALCDADARLLFAYRETRAFRFATTFGAYFVGSDCPYIGFATANTDGKSKYTLLWRNGNVLSEVQSMDVACAPDHVRAFFESGTLYLFDGSLSAYPLP